MKKRLRTLKPAKNQAVFALSFTVSELSYGCIGKRDRECLFRLAKEAAVTRQDFESAVRLREIQHENKPTRRA